MVSNSDDVNDVVFLGDNHFIAESADISGDVLLNSHVSIWFEATVNGQAGAINLGKGNQIESGAVIESSSEHSVNLGDFVMVGERSRLTGCQVGEGCLIGSDCMIEQGAVVGKYSMLAAESEVSAHMVIPDYALVMGSPAVVEQVLTPEQVETVEQDALNAQDVMMGLFKTFGRSK